MRKYDYLIVGAGLYGAMFANKAMREGKKCLVVDKNDFVGGFCYSETLHGIEVHKFGAHIFRTNNKDVWDFVNSICEFVPFINSPIANCKGKLYNLPFNMNTFNRVFGTSTPEEAMKRIREQQVPCANPMNAEDKALSLVGRDIYDMFIKGYTEKQWGRPCSELPPSILGRLPLRFTYDNNYYKAKYQGVPKYGYTYFIKKLLEGADVILDFEFGMNELPQDVSYDKLVYTGRIDKYFHYVHGKLDYRSVKFTHEYYPDTDNEQGVAVMNFCDAHVPYTRCIEHKHFLDTISKGTVVSYEYPCRPGEEAEPSYPIIDEKNTKIFEVYKERADALDNVIFGGRLGEYRYYSMDEIVEQFV